MRARESKGVRRIMVKAVTLLLGVEPSNRNGWSEYYPVHVAPIHWRVMVR